jgi:hypothetical protein
MFLKANQMWQERNVRAFPLRVIRRPRKRHSSAQMLRLLKSRLMHRNKERPRQIVSNHKGLFAPPLDRQFPNLRALVRRELGASIPPATKISTSAYRSFPTSDHAGYEPRASQYPRSACTSKLLPFGSHRDAASQRPRLSRRPRIRFGRS